MPFLPLSQLPDRPRKAIADEWLERLESELRDASVDRATLCRRMLAEIAYPQYAANWESAVADRARDGQVLLVAVQRLRQAPQGSLREILLARAKAKEEARAQAGQR